MYKLTTNDPGPQNQFKWKFFDIEIYTASDNIWPRYIYLKILNLRMQRNKNIEKIAFKAVQMKFLAMHITKQK